MPKPSPLEDVARRVKELAASGPLADVERNVRGLASHALARLDLVTREEFDAQARLLARMRDRLEALERRVEALEATKAAADDH